MQFMSQEHVDAMNRRLEAAPELEPVLRTLDRDYRMLYRLSDPAGTVYWGLTVGPGGVAFSLTELTNADVTLVADHREMVRASRLARDGVQADIDVKTEGDASILGRIGPAVEAARGIATLDVEYPT